MNCSAGTDRIGPVPAVQFTTSMESEHEMKTLKVATAALAATVLVAGSALAQPTPGPEQMKQESTPIHHAGGRHDQKLHEAAERARANGHRMQQTTAHAGGRHDVRAHEAAMKSDAARATAERQTGDPVK
jgi:hypothetical protein